MEGSFISLVVIGEREMTETELMLPTCTEYFQKLFYDAQTGMGQKWLMINIDDCYVLEDVKKCIEIRRKTKKK